MKEKTKKQKYLEMWEWFAEHSSKDKIDYEIYLLKKCRGDEYRYCRACAQCHYECSDCPVQWPGGSCQDQDSPYFEWSKAINGRYRKAAAEEVVRLIRTTWEYK